MNADEKLQKIILICAKSRGKWRVLAKKAGIPYTTFQNIANGRSLNPGIFTIEKMERAFPALRRKRKLKNYSIGENDKEIAPVESEEIDS